MRESTGLAIQHVEESAQSFRLTRLPDGKTAAPVTIPSPYEFPVEGLPQSNLMRELRWYLERFLDYPFPPETGHAERVLDALRNWGTEAFNALFDGRDTRGWLAAADILQVCSDDPHILSWPWEALFDPRASYVAHQRSIERRLRRVAAPQPLGPLPRDCVNILLVVARPNRGDVRYRSIARPLVELIESKGLPAHVDVLRPPTFDQLRAHLRAHPGYYHVLHFDGHGAYGKGADESQGSHGRLIFENADGGPDARSGGDLSELLSEHAVPAVVLSACQSAMIDPDAEDAFASLATALLQGGIRSVVAMAYSLHINGAEVFLPAFYGRLFQGGSVAEAAREGRREMAAHTGRLCACGRYPLEDWLLPVLYQQEPLDFSFAAQARPPERESRLPQEIREQREPHGFIGRDGPILEMERALHGKAPAILVQGLGGVGKTTLVRGFLRWLDDTGGLDSAMWFDFREIRTAEYVIHNTGQAFYGENFRIAANKLELLGDALRGRRVLMVWDNFESAAANLTDEDRSELARFLDAIRGGRGKVLITSRSNEEWLDPTEPYPLPMFGLDGAERWEYCDLILRELGLEVRRDRELSGLMDQLGGHPLAMRVTLPKLKTMTAGKIAEALRGNIADLGLSVSGDEEQGHLFATLRFVEQGLAEDLRPLLGLLGLHERTVSAPYLAVMATRVDATWTQERIGRLIAALSAAGLLRDIGNATFEMHPLLTSFLRSRVDATSERCERAFVAVMAALANKLLPLEIQQQRMPYLLYGANLHFAVLLAERLKLDASFAALLQFLADYAQGSRNFAEASRLYGVLAPYWAARGESKREGVVYHTLGIIAGRQRDFRAAREWYLKSIAIKETQGDFEGAAITYHQLGVTAQNQRDFAAAREWYAKSLQISEKQGIESNIASIYNQLGLLAREQKDFEAAREWYLKSIAIEEKRGNLEGAARSYHNLGVVMGEDRDFVAARGWYLKSLAIKMKQGNVLGAAATFHQLGRNAEEERDFKGARDWYLQSLAINEKQANLHGAAMTYGQLGALARLQGSVEDCGRWLVRSIAGFLQTHDQHEADRIIGLFAADYQQASPDEREKLESIWREGNLGAFPSK
jgi:tetratricopeptide (TPR) repeat protein